MEQDEKTFTKDGMQISKDTVIGILVVDGRQTYMAQLLEEKGYRVLTWDTREGQMPSCKDSFWDAGVIILPVPVSRIRDREKLELCLASHRDTIRLCIGGVFPEALVMWDSVDGCIGTIGSRMEERHSNGGRMCGGIKSPDAGQYRRFQYHRDGIWQVRQAHR